MTTATLTSLDVQQSTPWDDANPITMIEVDEIIEKNQEITEFNPVEAALQALRDRVKSEVYDITTTQGDKSARALRALCVDVRVAAEKTYKLVNAPLLARQRKAREMQAHVISEVGLIEDPIDTQIKAEEARKANEKRIAAEAEAKRSGDIRNAINIILGTPLAYTNCNAAQLGDHLVYWQNFTATEGNFQEFTGEANSAVGTVVARTQVMLEVALEREAEEAHRVAKAAADAAARIAAEKAQAEAEEKARQARLELDEMRAEMARRDQEVERQRVAEADRARLVAEEAERASAKSRAANEQFLKDQSDAFEAEKAAAQKLLDDERAEIARQRLEIAAQLAASLPKPAVDLEQKPVPALAFIAPEATNYVAEAEPLVWEPVATTPKPSDREIVTVLANAYSVSAATVVEWLGDVDLFDTTLSQE